MEKTATRTAAQGRNFLITLNCPPRQKFREYLSLSLKWLALLQPARSAGRLTTSWLLLWRAGRPRRLGGRGRQGSGLRSSSAIAICIHTAHHEACKSLQLFNWSEPLTSVQSSNTIPEEGHQFTCSGHQYFLLISSESCGKFHWIWKIELSKVDFSFLNVLTCCYICTLICFVFFKKLYRFPNSNVKVKESCLK